MIREYSVARLIEKMQMFFCSLEPENLSGDGEYSKKIVAMRGKEILKELTQVRDEFFRRYQFRPTEEDLYDFNLQMSEREILEQLKILQDKYREV